MPKSRPLLPIFLRNTRWGVLVNVMFEVEMCYYYICNRNKLPHVSLFPASFLSSLTLLGLPAEVYSQGTQFLAIIFFLPVMSCVVGQVFLPTFHNLQLQSSYTYLQLRFNKTVRFQTLHTLDTKHWTLKIEHKALNIRE